MSVIILLSETLVRDVEARPVVTGGIFFVWSAVSYYRLLQISLGNRVLTVQLSKEAVRW